MAAAKKRRYLWKQRNQPQNLTFSSSVLGVGQSDQLLRTGQGTSSCCHVEASSFAQARAAEIDAMLKAVSTKSSSSRIFQTLPRHMRRRAMCHNIKRMPRRLREIAKKEYEKATAMKKEQSKSKSRKARRRHGNLLLEFNRRQRKNKWLETHIWHAKRFHMVKKWGYCLGDKPTAKCYRACYRAMTNYCFLQDLSFYCCLELIGKEDALLRALGKVTSGDAGPTFAAAPCLSGKREGATVLYRIDQYPNSAVGPVTFIWKPKCVPDNPSEIRQLWIWTHPELKEDALKELKTACQSFEPVEPTAPIPQPMLTQKDETAALSGVTQVGKKRKRNDSDEQNAVPVNIGGSGKDALKELKTACQSLEPVEPTAPIPEPMLTQKDETAALSGATQVGKKRKRKGNEQVAVLVKKICGDGTRDPCQPVSWKSVETDVVVSDLTLEIVRYRLTGPLSNGVLTETVAPAPVHEEKESSDIGPHTWWYEYCKDPSNISLHARQGATFQLLQGISSPSEIPAGTVLGLTIGDPRLIMPRQKTNPTPGLVDYQENEKTRELILQGVSVDCAQSLIWSPKIRCSVTEKKIPEQELNRMRSKLLVPGSQLQLGSSESKIPILLIQQPGKRTGDMRTGWGSGWDILLPKGWGMAFWIPFIYRGVRVGGLQEGLKHSHYRGAPHFPHDFPDCPGGLRFSEEVAKEMMDKYKRRPPAKRTNYIKHGTVAPFHCPWLQITQEWELRYANSKSLAAIESKQPEAEFLCATNQALEQGNEATFIKPPLGNATDNVKTEICTSETSTVENEMQTEHDQSRTDASKPFCVIRSRKVLKCLSLWICPSSGKKQAACRLQKQMQQECTPHAIASLLHSFPKSLVWIRVSLLNKGSPEIHAMICIPSSEDLQKLDAHQAYSGPQESRHRDPIKQQVKKLKEKKKKKKVQVEVAQNTDVATKSVTQDSPELVQGVWPEPLPNLTSHCSRMLIGFATHGDFSLAAGSGDALGFVCLTGLLHMLCNQPKNKKGIVLVRNPSSLQYRFARLNIDV